MSPILLLISHSVNITEWDDEYTEYNRIDTAAIINKQ